MLLDDAVGLELVVLKNDQDTSDRRIDRVREFKLINTAGNLYTFECVDEPDHAGV